MNPPEDESAAAQEARRREQMCGRKRAFLSIRQARQPGVGAYKCPYCGLYHRTAPLSKLAGERPRHLK